MADCNVFVLPSRNEAMPVSILEAMALGMPVVATDVGCVRDVVIHGKTGFVVCPENPMALRAALRQVMSDEQLARDFGANGQQRAGHVFSLDQQVSGYLQLYREVCA
jgi:glycosyltransferase involved in cell wall biosynthesis